MTRKVLVFGIVALILVMAGAAISADVSKTMPIPPRQMILRGDEPVPTAPYYPSSPSVIAQSPGDTMGFTQYDYQSNGSSGHRIVVDTQGGIHVAWMNGHPYPGTRHIFYNCITAGGSPFPGIGQQVSRKNRDGYTQIELLANDIAAVFYHNAATGGESLFVSNDAFTCLGQFDYHFPPNRMGSNVIMWPYATVDRTGRMHVIATTNGAAGAAQPVGYTRSTDNGVTWSTLARVDTVEDISAVIVSSKVSDKVAIIYTNSIDTASQWKNDIYYIMSSDGLTWDWRNGKVNVTRYGRGDSLYAYTDLAAVYDYNDDLHMVWNAQYVTPTSIYYSGQLLHYDVASGTIHQIAQFDSLWLSGCLFGVWNFVYAKMSIATDIRSDIFVTYTSWDTSDCSGGGFANGDIYMQYSTNGGANWTQKQNVTDSHTPGCAPGDCDSDHWSSLAEKADTSLHLFYVNDKDPGGIPQTEGSITDNPMLYTSIHVPILSAINEDVNTPKSFELSQNYPNPFNARTNIDFELTKATHVDLSVYDVTGSKIATLVNGNLNAGSHQVNWDASDISSGVYYYTLKANGSEVSRKMTLLK